LTLAVALVLALALTGCAPKDAGVAILTGLDKKELAQGDLPCRSYYKGETLVPLCEVARALGYSAEWDSANQTAIIDDEYIQKATLTAGSKTTLFEGHLQVINVSREVELAEALAVQEVSADSAVALEAVALSHSSIREETCAFRLSSPCRKPSQDAPRSLRFART